MNTRFFLAVLVASLLAFFGGWLVFGVAFSDYYDSNMNKAAKILIKEPMAIWAIAISNIAWTLLITWVLQKTGSTTFMKGLSTSLWISFLVILVFDLSIYGFWDIYGLGFIAMDIIVTSIFWGIVGAIAGAVLGSGKNAVAPV